MIQNNSDSVVLPTKEREEKRIGILTFHRAHNIGAMLQAYALQQFLSHYCCVEIIDYRPACIETMYYPVKGLWWGIKNQIKWFLHYSNQRFLAKKRKGFIRFGEKYLFASKKTYNERNIFETDSQYDFYIAGSDQIWNIELTNNDLHFFLDFVGDNKKKKTYAASFGKEWKNVSFEDGRWKSIKELLDDFTDILLRENNGIEILKRLKVNCVNNYRLVCDPVFLLQKKEWISCFHLSESMRQDYILLYLVAKPTYSLEFTHRLAAEKGLKVNMLVHMEMLVNVLLGVRIV